MLEHASLIWSPRHFYSKPISILICHPWPVVIYCWSIENLSLSPYNCCNILVKWMSCFICANWKCMRAIWDGRQLSILLQLSFSSIYVLRGPGLNSHTRGSQYTYEERFPSISKWSRYSVKMLSLFRHDDYSLFSSTVYTSYVHIGNFRPLSSTVCLRTSFVCLQQQKQHNLLLVRINKRLNISWGENEPTRAM